MKVALCIIAKNEEKLIAKAINSASGLADLVVVGDTGSQDRTIEIADELGAICVIGLDPMHKAESRNAVIRTAEDEGADWIVILDCDEKIENPHDLRKFLVGMENEKQNGVYIRLRFVDDKDRSTLEYSQLRIWRAGSHYYKYRAHELPEATQKNTYYAYTNFLWLHNPPQERATWKLQYTLDRLLLDVEENPYSSRSKFYLARQYMYMKMWRKALDWFKTYMLNPDHDEAQGHLFMAKCYSEIGDNENKVDCLWRSIKVNPIVRDAWGNLAEEYYSRKEYHVAYALLQAAENMPVPQTGYIGERWYGWHFYDLTSRALYRIGKFPEGLQYAKKASDMYPESEQLQKNVLWFLAALGDDDAAYMLHGANVHTNQPRHKILAGHTYGPKVLDIGCGTADLFVILEELHPKWTLHGVDHSEVAITLAEDRTEKATYSTQWPNPKTKWNTIVISQVLEHLDPDTMHEMLTKACGYSAKGGQLLITVPKGTLVQSPNHKQIFTENTLQQMLSQYGDVEFPEWDDDYRLFAKVTNVSNYSQRGVQHSSNSSNR